MTHMLISYGITLAVTAITVYFIGKFVADLLKEEV